MKSLLGPAAYLLAASSVTAALLFGSAATAQAGVLSPPCPGGCAQLAPDGFQVSATQESEFVPKCSDGCIRWVPAAAAAGTEGNWDPH